jgi:hypothetical protein
MTKEIEGGDDNDKSNEDEFDLNMTKDEDPKGFFRRFLARLRKARNENLVTILSIGILIFSAVTGILAQELNEVDREASTYETSSTEYISQARTLESIENQVILREEILLTEVKHLALEQTLYQAEVDFLNQSMSQNTDEYYAALLAKDLISYQQSGQMLDDGLLIMCEQSASCQQDTVQINGSGYNYSTFTFTIGQNNSVDLFLANVDDVVSEYDRIFESGNLTELNGMTHNIGHVYDAISNSNTFTFIGEEGGIEGYLTRQNIEYEDLGWQLLEQEDEHERFLTLEQDGTLNWIYYSGQANHHYELYKMSNDTDDFMDWAEDYDDSQYSIQLANFYSEKADDMSDNITYTKGIMLHISSNIQSLEQADLTTELNAVSDQFNLASSQYQRYLESYHSAQTGLENAQELIDSLLELSLANKSGYILPSSGEFISEEFQESFIEGIHIESMAKYELSKEAVNEAEDVRNVATEVSSSVMFVSVGNVTLGIAGGMISRASFGLANARSIFVLVASGMAVGIIGLVNALNILI